MKHRHYLNAASIYFFVDVIKRLIGVVSGLFCTLIVAWMCAYFLKIDFIWYNSLVKVTFVPSGGWFTAMVTVCYISAVWVISRLVCGKHFFPSMALFALLGALCILYIFVFFTKKALYPAAVISVIIAAVSVYLFIRFCIKDFRTALIYLPSAAFNCYCFVTTFAIAMYN